MIDTTIDLRIFDNHPEALAKITEAIARVYFDNVLNKRVDISEIAKAYTIAFNLCPNYRLPFREKIEIYKNCKHEITSLPLDNIKPQ